MPAEKENLVAVYPSSGRWREFATLPAVANEMRLRRVWDWLGQGVAARIDVEGARVWKIRFDGPVLVEWPRCIRRSRILEYVVATLDPRYLIRADRAFQGGVR